jgi:hypothetical protein
MKLHSGHLRSCLNLAEGVGSIQEVGMYENDFIKVAGVTDDGKEFYVSINILDNKEEKEDA